MSESVRHVFDTNTLVSAALFEHSKPGQALRHALRRGHVLLSSSTLEELAEVLQREKFERYVTAIEREEFLAAFVDRALFMEPTEEVRACRDAKDDKFLELAVSGRAAYIISGDDDLLVGIDGLVKNGKAVVISDHQFTLLRLKSFTKTYSYVSKV